jgi:hypothetical protein
VPWRGASTELHQDGSESRRISLGGDRGIERDRPQADRPDVRPRPALP